MASKKVRTVAKRKRAPAERVRATPKKPTAVPAPAGTAVAPRPFVVGIGASAGGLEALQTFFRNVPSDSGMAFVVVTHQHPTHASLLASLLAKSTRMPVEAARDAAVLQPDHVYVSVPGKTLAILSRALQLMDPIRGPELHLPIDYFFRSLARDQGERAICIVLSGTGTDGTLGLRAIKGNGGMAMVQDESSAHFAGMPQSAAATLLADHVLSPDRMAVQMLAYARGAHPPDPAEGATESLIETALPKLFVLLRNRMGHDFSGYKRHTIQRRVARRMRMHQLSRGADYVRLVQAQPHEADLLFQELLITVTQFFRDPQSFEALAATLAQSIDSRQDEVALRVWVPGCSTGEEAYSIAILITELAERAGKRPDVQVFATDINPKVIELARTGLYPQGIAADVSAERLRRFFVVEGMSYRICKQIRDCIVFATQDMLRDPPFTRLDLLSCRNLLIYLNPELQQRVLPLFHYALKPGGALWLGTSETASGYSDLFTARDRKWKIYERRNLPSSAAPSFDLRIDSRPTEPERKLRRNRDASKALSGLTRAMEGVLLDRFAPATLVISEQGDIAYIHGRTGAYLEPAEGQPRHNVFAMAREGLRLSLQAAVRAAAATDHEVTQRGIPVHTHGGVERVTLVVQRIIEPESLRGLFRLSLSSDPPAPAPALGRPSKKRSKNALAITPYAASELKTTRDSLDRTLNELQTSNEDLKSTNEELQSTNEELQSTNEELETSKEELQSVNEELQTVNTELQLKNDELAQVNDDMQNLLNGTEIATLFLDRELRIKRFTEQARRVISLIATDVGRPISDLVRQVRYERLSEDAYAVLRTLQPHEEEAQALDGRWLLVRILPYRTSQDRIDGVVITFVDIDRVKRAELLAASREFAESIVQTVRSPLLVLDSRLHVVSTNRAFLRLLDADKGDVRGLSLFDVGRGVFSLPRLRTLLEDVLSEGRVLEAFEFTAGTGQQLQLNARRLELAGVGAGHVLVDVSAVGVEQDFARSQQ